MNIAKHYTPCVLLAFCAAGAGASSLRAGLLSGLTTEATAELCGHRQQLSIPFCYEHDHQCESFSAILASYFSREKSLLKCNPCVMVGTSTAVKDELWPIFCDSLTRFICVEAGNKV